MYDKSLAVEILIQIHDATLTILKRFAPITSAEDFTDSDAGMEKLDSICMLLIAIGESLKNLDKVTNGTLLQRFPMVDWKRAKGMRDFISHHYFKVDADVIFHVCENHIEPMARVLKKMIEDEMA